MPQRRLHRLLQSFSEAGEGGTLHIRGYMRVGIHGVRDLRVAEDLLHYLRVLALLQHERGEGVPEVVEVNRFRQACSLSQGLVVARSDVIPVHRAAGLIGEDKILILSQPRVA